MGTTGGGQLKFGGFLAYQRASTETLRRPEKISGFVTPASAPPPTPPCTCRAHRTTCCSAAVFRSPASSSVRMWTSPALPPAQRRPCRPDPNAPSSHVRLDVHIFSAPQLDFQNSYAQLAGSVDLRIRGTVAQPAILGPHQHHRWHRQLCRHDLPLAAWANLLHQSGHDPAHHRYRRHHPGRGIRRDHRPAWQRQPAHADLPF